MVKICIGYKVVSGPWGGGNSFFSSLTRELSKAGHIVVNNLNDNDIDVIVITDPRYGRRNKSIPFSYRAAWLYTREINRNCLIVHRINECDERKNTRHMNQLLKKCNQAADYTVFVGSWLKSLDLWQGPKRMPNSVILNGSDQDVFNRKGFIPWNGSGPLKLVTHHWGGNWMKGFDIYDHIDQMLAQPKWKGKIEFSYIGNTPDGYKFKNARLVEPLSGEALADALRENHAYVTGSLNEPGGNHQNEGAQCGLPVLYLRSGCMPEYLSGHGLEFTDKTDFESKLLELIENYELWEQKTKSYPHNSYKSCQQWISLLENIIKKKESFLLDRDEYKIGIWRKIRNIWRK
ncbi:glycosyltransferase family 1 protein [Thalassospira lucentensis]|uniref:glycosyltransferase family 1 protein n=1 Tax=Thalassospira lucentensis TaxID=168935 RepID=UPI000527033B|nr:glycosyltransferase family 1 protein [Thalassospira lucentensis]RCK30581.1 hypothetical protein TH1_01255 [Thalassospira lucentensis MCCC 1A00383 = DSM 14000]